jgi:hypothetical protein
MNDLPEHLRIKSEALEPVMQHLLGHWFAQCQHFKTTEGPRSAAYVDAMQNWWWGMQKMNSLLVACQGTTHATIAWSNYMRSVKAMIEAELQIKFSFMDGDDLNFRALVPFELEFSWQKKSSERKAMQS